MSVFVERTFGAVLVGTKEKPAFGWPPGLHALSLVSSNWFAYPTNQYAWRIPRTFPGHNWGSIC